MSMPSVRLVQMCLNSRAYICERIRQRCTGLPFRKRLQRLLQLKVVRLDAELPSVLLEAMLIHAL